MFVPPSAASRSGRSPGGPRQYTIASYRNKNTACLHGPQFASGSQREWSCACLYEKTEICRIKPNRRDHYVIESKISIAIIEALQDVDEIRADQGLVRQRLGRLLRLRRLKPYVAGRRP